MPTSIAEGVQESEGRLKAEKAIAKRFPDAILREVAGDYVWMAESAVEHVTDFTIIAGESYSDWERNRGKPRVYVEVYSYLTVEGMRVYAPPGSNSHHLVWIRHLKDKHPEVYKVLVATAK